MEAGTLFQLPISQVMQCKAVSSGWINMNPLQGKFDFETYFKYQECVSFGHEYVYM